MANEQSGLTERQRKATEGLQNSNRVVVSASAGSGKTTTLVETYRKLLDQTGSKKHYERVLVITFTNEAAYELKQRIFAAMDDMEILTAGRISTIHSFCNSLISAHVSKLSFNPDYRIAEEFELEELEKDVAMRLLHERSRNDSWLAGTLANLSYNQKPIKDLIDIVRDSYRKFRNWGMMIEEVHDFIAKSTEAFLLSDTYTAGTSGDGASSGYADWLRQANTSLSQLITEFWKEIDDAKRKKGLVSYDDILYLAYTLLTSFPDAAEEVADAFDCIMVDEFQDTDLLQKNIIEIVGKKAKIFIVGDEKQAIYEWRNADPGILRQEVDSARKREGLFLLNENFRSNEQIISFLNHVFEKIFKETGIDYSKMISVSSSQSGEKGVNVFVPGVQDSKAFLDAEATMICDEIDRLVKSGYAYSDFAVLFRKRDSIDIYSAELRRRNIPFIRVGGTHLFKRPEVRDMINFIHHLSDPSDRHYALLVMRSPLFRISDDELIDIFSRDPVSWEEGTEGREGMHLYRRVMQWATGRRNMRPSEVLLGLISMTRYDLIQLHRIEGIQCYANVMKFVDFVRRIETERRCDVFGLSNLLLLADSIKEEEYSMNEKKSNAVRLMTVHACKGLEFKVVFVADPAARTRDIERYLISKKAGIIPPVKLAGEGEIAEIADKAMRAAKEEERSEEEEKRLLYVAFTRAREILYFSIPPDGRDGWLKSFLDALPDGFSDGRCGKIWKDKVRIFSHSEGVERVDTGVRSPVPPEMGIQLNVEERLRISATSISEYMPCAYRARMDEETSQANGSDAALNRGERIHDSLEHYDYLGDLFVEDRLGRSSGGITEARSFISSTYGKIAADAARQGKLRREVPFSLRVGRHIISGKIDLMAILPDEIVVVDYKTGRKRDIEHLLQIKVYALALSKLFSKQRFRLVVFYTGTQTGIEIILSPSEIDTFERDLSSFLDAFAKGERQANPSNERCASCYHSNVCTYSAVRGRLK